MRFKFVAPLAALLIAGLYWAGNSQDESVPAALLSRGDLAEKQVTSPLLSRDETQAKAEVPRASEDSSPELILPAIFSGSDIPEGIRADEAGNLIVDGQLKLTFDYFTQIMGIQGADPEALRRQIESYLQQKLNEPALSQALDIFNRYWDYSLFVNASQDDEAMRQIKDSFQGQYDSDHIAAIQAFRQERDAVRNEYFNQEEMSGLFSEDKRYEQFMDDRMALANTEGNRAERWLQLAQLERALPEAEQSARKRMSMMQRFKQFQQIQNDPSLQGRALDEQLFDEQERQQFKAIQSQRQAWREKKSAYDNYKSQLVGSGSVEQEALHALLDAYMREQQFSPQDIRRVQALENRLQ